MSQSATLSGASPRQRPSLRQALARPEVEGSITVVAFLVLILVYGLWLGGKFLNVDARLLDVHQNVPILLLGLAVMVTLVAGQFDLSVASMSTLTTFLIIGLPAKDGWPFGLALIACLAVGVLGGLLNALIVEGLGVNAFIATLGTSGFFAGASNVYSSGTQITPGVGHELPTWFSDFGSFSQQPPSVVLWLAVALGAYSGFRALARVVPDGDRSAAIRAVIVAVILAALFVLVDLKTVVEHASWVVTLLVLVGIALYLLLEMTTYGRYLRATGANREAARLAGVQVRKEVVKSFVLGSVLAALAGVVLGASQGSAAPGVAATFLLPAFAAAFLSTVVLSTGRFTVWGTIVGGIFVVWISQGLIIGGVEPQWTDIVNGAVLVCAVALSAFMRRRRT